MDKTEKKDGAPKRDEALAERLLRRVLDRVGAVVDRSLGRTLEPQSGFTTTRLIERMNRLIDERVRNDPKRGRIAPHVMKLKIEWGTHSEAPPESVRELENEVLAAAIDHINDQRLRTLAPVEVETLVDIFTTGIAVDPSFGAFEEELQREDEERQRAAAGAATAAAVPSAGLGGGAGEKLAGDARLPRHALLQTGRQTIERRARDGLRPLAHASERVEDSRRDLDEPRRNFARFRHRFGKRNIYKRPAHQLRRSAPTRRRRCRRLRRCRSQI